MIDFSLPFKVYVDGVEVPNVVSLQVSVDRCNSDTSKNLITLHYQTDTGSKRVLTTELGGVTFENLKTNA